ncbi:hypothetical protein PC9H_001680 [Pleurotus ostreatus]|uniref:TERF2-interacting telomeric protein 1 Myb domain-containing protein n=1 Tax=Pleurotus ostreatus TaxID=5322 RepID=A0A8H7A791_PLEOS|nr:uncharacterized protein PC9H_001680 [Pleurotus ostreatus]KAF7441331.1 hypothetical protein PC9H_001680 [Pleurotus ostreatus]KAJ8699127.1 Proline-, glutamic acid- and leucine-rich protein 1, variant 2 [Pleurotus ostreatus]
MSKSSGARNPFTHDEDILLAKYIATHNPGRYGRSGNALYKKLVANEDQRWKWSQRHTWQSWRGRYTDHTGWFDQAIAKYQAKKNIAVEEAETSKSTRTAGRSDVKQKRKQQDDDVIETVDSKPEKKRQKVAATTEERGTQEELGTPPTTTTNGPPLITTDSQISKASENSDVKGKWKREEEENTMLGIGAKQEEKQRNITTQAKPTTPPTNVTEEDDPLFTPNGRTNEEAEDEGEVAEQVTPVDEGKPVQEPGSRDGGIYPSLDKLPSPTLAAPMPGSFVNGTSRPPKPKPRKRKSVVDDDPFVSSPAPDSPVNAQISSQRVRKPPMLTQRPFGGTVHYSSPRCKEDDSEHESDGQTDGHWPPIRAKAVESVVGQGELAGKTRELPKEDSQQRRLSHREVQTDAEMSVPLASTSRVTLEVINQTGTHQATKRSTESLDLNVVEKRRLKSVDHRRRRMSAMADFVRTDELSTRNVERLRERYDGRRHSATGLATRSSSKDSDLRINSLKRGVQCSTRSPPAVPPPFIPYKTLVPPSAVPNEERDLINSLGVSAAIAHLAKMHGFGQEVAWNVWKAARSIRHTDAVLKGMRQSAEMEGLKLLEEVIDADRTSASDVPEPQADSDDADDEDDGTSVRADPDEHRITAESTPAPRRRRKSLPFEYTPIRPGQELENDWQPPPSTRAATLSRLFLQGRWDEALAREQRRASLSSRSLTYTPDLHTSVTKTEPSNDMQMTGVSLGLPSRTQTPAFQWTKKHDDVMLRAGFETETDVFKLESQVGDVRAMRQHFVRLLDILHPTQATA